MSLTSAAAAVTHPVADCTETGVLDLKNGTTTGPAAFLSPRWMCEAVASMPCQLSWKHTWVPLSRTVTWPLAPGAPGPGRSAAPVRVAARVVHPSPAARLLASPLPPGRLLPPDPVPPEPPPYPPWPVPDVYVGAVFAMAAFCCGAGA